MVTAAEKLAEYTWSEKQPERYQPNEDQQRTINDVYRKFTSRIHIKQPYERTWFLTHAHIVDFPHLTYVQQFNSFSTVRSSRPRQNVRMVVNFAQAYYLRTLARLTSARPEISVSPATATQEDSDRARQAGQLSEYQWERRKIQEKLRAACCWMLETGTGILRADWNPMAGARGKSGIPVGDIDVSVVSPYELDWDPQASDPSTAKWILFNRVRSTEWVRENFPDAGEIVPAEETYIHTLYYQRTKSLVGAVGFTWQQQISAADYPDAGKSTTVLEYWERPSRKYPRGRRVITASRVLLHDGPNPYEHGEFPIVMFREVPVSGRIWGKSKLESALPILTDLNLLATQEVRIRNLMVQPKILAPTSAKFGQDKFTNEPGEIVRYQESATGAKPEAFLPADLPSTYDRLFERRMRQLEDVLGWHEASRGQMTRQARAGRIVSLLQAADDTVLAPTADEMQDALAELSRMMLSLAAQFYTEKRLVKVTGENGTVKSFEIMGRDLVGHDRGADYYDVRIRVGPSLPRDRSSRRQELIELIQGGVLDPKNPADRAAIRKSMIELGYAQDALVEERLDEQWAREENENIYAGKKAGSLPVEDHEIHIRVHRIETKTGRFREASNKIKMQFLSHIQEHEQVAAMEQARKAALVMAAQQAMAPPPPAGPEGPPPQGPPPEAFAAPESPQGAGGAIPAVAPIPEGAPGLSEAAAQLEQAAEGAAGAGPGM